MAQLPWAPSLAAESSAVNLHNLRLESGSIVCFGKDGFLMRAECLGGDIRLMEGTTPMADPIGQHRIPHYPHASAFLVEREVRLPSCVSGQKSQLLS